MDVFLWIIVALLLTPMILGPVLVKFTHWVSANANISAVSPDMLDPNIRTFIDRAKMEFEALGFRFVGYMTLADFMPGITSYFGLFTNDADKTSGMAAFIRHASGRTVQYCEFSNKYSDGHVINVNNSPMMGGYKNPNKSTYRYPKVDSIKKLYEINNWVNSQDMKAAYRLGLVKGRELAMVCDHLNDEIRLQADYGYYFSDESHSRYRLTWKGAIIMTEKQVIPIKNILTFLDLRSARKAISGSSLYDAAT
jgi:hypothetical protein